MTGYIWVRAGTLIADQFEDGAEFPTSNAHALYSTPKCAKRARADLVYKHIWFLWEVLVSDGCWYPQERIYRHFPGNRVDWQPTRIDLLFEDY